MYGLKFNSTTDWETLLPLQKGAALLKKIFFSAGSLFQFGHLIETTSIWRNLKNL